MTLTLTLVRHGQTHFNARGILQGSSNSPLTRTGQEGVRTTARHLAASTFTAAYSSPSGRAVTTAVEILRHHEDLRLRVDADLREYDFGMFERRPERELEAREPWAELVPAVLAGTHPGLPHGETGEAFMTRTREVFARIAERHPEGEVLVVGHGLTLGAYLWTLQGGPLVPLPNASVSTVRVADDGTAEVVEVGLDVAGHGLRAARTAPAPATEVPVSTAEAGVGVGADAGLSGDAAAATAGVPAAQHA
ncbi:histidine phosphatase family protein [Xylanimonas oleitrophica]|uniref:Histidine phosphatase family protein n=1 Tax=Xylanimonas oleitrophica TaxID=2607479 RepID=A0A2W5WQG0_9MICO|nr:histidine phosphatase family protein [Xylanimonas oleitrophica]PZR52923.1 histidine phosphatase family protein [Xylanimonas oleitrophica]